MFFLLACSLACSFVLRQSYVAQARLEVSILVRLVLMPPSPQCWDCEHVLPSRPICNFFSKQFSLGAVSQLLLASLASTLEASSESPEWGSGEVRCYHGRHWSHAKVREWGANG